MLPLSVSLRSVAFAALVAAAALLATPARATSFDDPVYMANACKGALQTLLANNYDFRVQRDPNAVRRGASLSFANAYRTYTAAATECRALLAEHNAYVPRARQADLAALVERHRAQINREMPGLAFTDYVGYLDGRAGVEAQGSRVLQYCPGADQAEFSCNFAGPRIALSARLLSEYMDFVIAANAPAPQDHPFPVTDLTFETGQRYYSTGGSHYLVFQSDGNLVVYDATDRLSWALNLIIPNWQSTTRVVMQSDGNLVAYGPSGPTWATGTHGNPGAVLGLGDDGRLTITASGGGLLWDSSRR